MDEILYLKKIKSVEWVVFNDFFNSKIPKDILEFLSKYQRVKFGYNFNQPVDNLPPKLKEINFGLGFCKPLDNLPNGLKKNNI